MFNVKICLNFKTGHTRNRKGKKEKTGKGQRWER